MKVLSATLEGSGGTGSERGSETLTATGTPGLPMAGNSDAVEAVMVTSDGDL